MKLVIKSKDANYKEYITIREIEDDKMTVVSIE